MLTPEIQRFQTTTFNAFHARFFLAAAVYESLKPSLQERNQFEAVKLALLEKNPVNLIRTTYV
jgi:hypothetical protein